MPRSTGRAGAGRTGVAVPVLADSLADVVAELAAEGPGPRRDPRVAAVERLLRAPVSVAVHGREGVGRGAVASSLRALGAAVAGPGLAADIDVLVVADTITEEDRTFVAAQSNPSVLVLNKADLGGAGPGGPVRAAAAQAGRLEALLRLPVVPMVALLTLVRIDDDDVAALRTLVGTPADVSSVDAFVSCPHPLPAEVRRALIDRLDRFGLAHAILAVSDGAGADEVAARLHIASGADAVRGAIGRAATVVGYLRCCTAVRILRALAAERDDERLAAWIDGDEVVFAVMTAAVGVVEATGAAVDRGDDIGAHTRRALRWQGLAQGPLDALHRRCAADIARGSLRLVEACGG